MRRYILAMVATAMAATTTAQSNDLTVRSDARGLLLNRDVMSVAEIGSFSQNTLQFGTARSMGLAGAMTSLGGDASSMFINPAGLGMSLAGDFTITPIVVVQSSNSGSGKSTLTLSNLSTTLNLYENDKSKLISLNMGIGYNRISDLNYSYSTSAMGSGSSISRLFSEQLTDAEVTLSELYGSDNPDWSTFPTYLWGAALGYKSGLTFQSSGEVPSDWNELNPNEPIVEADSPTWKSTWISDDATIDQRVDVISSGSIGEYDIAIGGNLDNKLYFGFTFGVQSLYQRLDLNYRESYNNPSSFDQVNELNYSEYNQSIITSGAGVNLKVGFTYRPTESMRIGVAYHSPTWFSLSRKYQISMGSLSTFNDGNGVEELSIVEDSPVLIDDQTNRWKYRTPSRLLLGYSYTFGLRGLISIDYQRDWYGSMKMRQTPYGISSDLYSGMSDIYQSVNTVKIGGEYKLSPAFALRGGYGFSSSMVNDDVTMADLLDTPTTDKVAYYSAGVGYSPNGGITFDLTYMHHHTEYTSYTLFYGNSTTAQSASYKTDMNRSYIALSMILKM